MGTGRGKFTLPCLRESSRPFQHARLKIHLVQNVDKLPVELTISASKLGKSQLSYCNNSQHCKMRHNRVVLYRCKCTWLSRAAERRIKYYIPVKVENITCQNGEQSRDCRVVPSTAVRPAVHTCTPVYSSAAALCRSPQVQNLERNI